VLTQSRVQQLLPSVHASPWTRQLPAPVLLMVAHNPVVALLAILHTPVQQSLARAHTSPSEEQNDARAHTLFWQLWEQQVEPEVQALPSVVQPPPLMGWQVPPAGQLPEQHSAPDPQPVPFCLQAVAEQLLPEQFRLQQSVDALQGMPSVPHMPVTH
jgi:hypothetical protein